jgi:NADPH-dependent 2,4-dienoyl-CoA reductase/sulfur reductase-like enzyme
MKIVIVGYGPGGAAAALAARMFNSNAEITIVTEETIESHKKPGASLALEFPDTKELSIKDWSIAALAKKRIEVLSGTTVIDGDSAAQILHTKNKKATSTLKYDRLVLATGGNPNIPDIPGLNLLGVYTIQTIADTAMIGRQLKGIQRVVIVGAGFSGLEVAERLIALGKDVHMVVRSRLMRRQLEEPMSVELQSRLPDILTFHMDRSPTAVIGETQVRGIMIGNTMVEAEAALFMTGVRPNTTLAKALGAKTGKLGGISVDEQMQTSVKGIFAVGDCVEMRDTYTGKSLLLPIGSIAARAGRQAGVAAAGGRKVYSDVAIRFQYDRLFGNDVICVGHSSTTAASLGLKTTVQYIEDPSEFSKAALVTDSEGQLIGGQVIAPRQGSRLGFEILDRVESRAKLKEKPLLKPRHERLRDFLETSFGPIQ